MQGDIASQPVDRQRTPAVEQRRHRWGSKPQTLHDRAVRKDLEEGKDTQSWVVIADQSKSSKTFTCLKWDEVLQDLNSENPEYLDVRNLDKGI